MKKLFLIAVSVAFAGAFSSCKKDDNKDNPPTPPPARIYNPFVLQNAEAGIKSIARVKNVDSVVYSYNASQQMNGMSFYKQDSTGTWKASAKLIFAYEGDNLTNVSVNVGQALAMKVCELTFAYDANNRLTNETWTSPMMPNVSDLRTYTYDSDSVTVISQGGAISKMAAHYFTDSDFELDSIVVFKMDTNGQVISIAIPEGKADLVWSNSNLTNIRMMSFFDVYTWTYGQNRNVNKLISFPVGFLNISSLFAGNTSANNPLTFDDFVEETSKTYTYGSFNDKLLPVSVTETTDGVDRKSVV